MAHLWTRESYESDSGQWVPGEWVPTPLEGDALAVPGAQAVGAPAAPSRALPAQLLRRTTSAGEIWILIGSPAVRVNGNRLDAGICLLRDRDELRTGGSQTFFSAESLPLIAPFPGGEWRVFCPRCNIEIEPGSPAVGCPQCQVWHHQSDKLPCWMYAERCTMCDQPTPLGAGFRWTPENL